MKIYRHIFFNKSSFTKGNGNEDIGYTGNLYPYCTGIASFFSLYDKSKDLLISCNSCKAKDIKSIVKVSNNGNIIEEKASIKLPKTKAAINSQNVSFVELKNS